MIDKYGYWQVDENIFTSKVEALLYASKNNKQIKFVYHDSVWKNFNTNLLGKVPLDLLYRDRAIQLREKYKYLKLYYSGGSDSHNILMTFINNNIKLDEIVVRWSKELIEGNFYFPNKKDRSAFNTLSEWDFAIKPTLDWLKNKHPEIKITINDYVSKISVENIENSMFDVNHTRSGLIQHMPIYVPYEKDTTGHIFGTDKPLLYLIDKKIYMYFNDLALTALYINHEEEHFVENKECFYWAPDLPLLAYEMAYQFAQHFVRNPEERKLLPGFGTVDKKEMSMSEMIQLQNNMAREICYTTWDNRFQADKPKSGLARDKFLWFFIGEKFEKPKQAFLSGVRSKTEGINKEFLKEERLRNGEVYHNLLLIASDFYYVCELE